MTHTVSRHTIDALIPPDTRRPVAVECPDAMLDAVRYVLSGEYESGFSGTGLDILDIGANVGSFALWARLRWPASRIRCYEPNPGTFGFLTRNLAGLTDVTAVNAAVYPGGGRLPFFARYDGDGEAGLAAYATDTFEARVVTPAFAVDVIDPKAIGRADIVKIDIEGGEPDVLAGLDLSATSLVLVEFQNRRGFERMHATMAGDFEVAFEDVCPWDPILDYMDYRRDLMGDVYGRLFFARRGGTRLTRDAP